MVALHPPHYEVPHIFRNAWNRVVRDRRITEEEWLDLVALTQVTTSTEDERFLRDFEQVSTTALPSEGAGKRSYRDVLLDAAEQAGLNIEPFEVVFASDPIRVERKTPPPSPQKKLELSGYSLGYSQSEFRKTDATVQTFKGVHGQLHWSLTNTDLLSLKPSFRVHATVARNGDDFLAETGLTPVVIWPLVQNKLSLHGGVAAAVTYPEGFAVAPVVGASVLFLCSEATFRPIAGRGFRKEQELFIGLRFNH